MQVFFLVECGLLRPRPRPLTPEEARCLGHGAVLVWQDDLCSSDVWNQVVSVAEESWLRLMLLLTSPKVFKDGRDWEPPFLRYVCNGSESPLACFAHGLMYQGMYNFRHRDESSRLWKFLFTAKRNVLYDNAKYLHMRTFRVPSCVAS